MPEPLRRVPVPRLVNRRVDSGALDTIHGSPFGRISLALVGLGLIGYGIFATARSGHGMIGMPSEDDSDSTSSR